MKSTLTTAKSLCTSGFALGLHVVYTAPSIMLQTYRTDWTAKYVEKGMVVSDPTVHWAFQNRGAARWSEMDLPDPQNVMPQAAEYGLAYGCVTSIQPKDVQSMGFFARDDREFTDDEIETLLACTQKMHDLTDPSKPLSIDIRSDLKSLSVMLTTP
ncbi:hypothetical protein BVC71_04045 [Marivivens niveibacter]|uniref:Transcription factor LuxR-like autoinducer-binding domain-containing protein n=1 Tax=Marivivens niveibacter TaxID=1930667 RepID=A0A251X2U7_9RHOB|nr:hypothetical protein BVC71_04045 [Marivivens niveibacter]